MKLILNKERCKIMNEKEEIIFLENFIKERNKATISLDEPKIYNYCLKYGIKIPENKIVFWAGIHKSRLNIPELSKEEISASEKWLKENGFSPIPPKDLIMERLTILKNKNQ